jgi:hypothetical protein
VATPSYQNGSYRPGKPPFDQRLERQWQFKISFLYRILLRFSSLCHSAAHSLTSICKSSQPVSPLFRKPFDSPA